MIDRTRCCVLAVMLSLIWLPAYGGQTISRVAVPEEAHTAALDEPTPVSPDVTLGEFQNGFRYFIRENQEPENRISLRLVVNVGSIVEDDDQRGLAHFLEHMAFNGTENFAKQELISFMESIGMQFGAGINAGTSIDETVYMLELPADNPEHLATAFQILEDWAHGLTLDPEEIDLERGVVIEELRFRGGASQRLREQQFPVLFSGSRYAERHDVGGTAEDIENFEHDALRRFYADWYRPDLMGVIAVGDFDTGDIEALVREHFADFEGSESPRERPAYGVPDHDGTLVVIATDPEMPQTSVDVIHKMPPETDWTVGGYRQRIVERLYNGMLNDRFGEMARRSNPPFLRAGSSSGQLVRSKGAYILNAAVTEDGVEEGLEALFVESERVARHGFTESELERQKTVLLRGMERSYTDRANRRSGTYASEYTRAFLDGESIPGIEYEYELHQRFLPEITLEEVNRLATDWVRRDNRVIMLSGPRKDDLVLPTEAALLDVVETVDGLEIAPYVDTVLDQPLLAEVPAGSEIVREVTLERDITEWYLANGIRVVLKPTDFQDDQIVFTGFSPGGTSLVSDEEFFPAQWAISLVQGSGLADFDATELGRVLAGQVARASAYINTFEEGLNGSASPSDLETLFQLIYLRFTEPRVDEDYYAAWLTQNAQALANRDATPGTAFSDTYTRIITQDHPRSRPATLETLEEADLYESFAFYQDRFADASDFTFVFVGNIDFDAMRPMVERYLGALPAIGREETWRDTGVRPPTGVIEETVRRGIEPQSQTVISFTGPFQYLDQSQRTGIRALGMALEPRLLDRLREELGATYSVSVQPQTQFRPVESYTLMVIFTSDPERADELVDTVLAEIRELQMTGPTESQTADVRETLFRWFETNFQQNNAWLSQLTVDYQLGIEPGSSVDTFLGSVESLTAERIQQFAQQYFNLENYVRVTLLPEE